MADPLPQTAAGFENPTELSVGMVNTPNGGTRVTFIIKNNVVQTVVVLSPKEAASVGEALQKIAAQVQTGLFVPAGSAVHQV